MAQRSSSGGDSRGPSGMSLLRDAAVNWGWTIARTHRDDIGVFALKLHTGDEYVYGITKNMPYQGCASFPKKVASRASDNDCPVIVFFGEKPRLGNSHVFDSDTVLQDGYPNMECTSPTRRKLWHDIPLEKGILLGDYISGRETVLP
jgi:hypothetical protein